jgi:hypothetical protein
MIVEELEKSNPTNTVLKLYWLPTLKAAIELNGGNSAQALESLEAAAPYELGEPPPTQEGTLYPAYLRGEAYLLARQGQAAATEFQKFLDHRGVVLNLPLGALATCRDSKPSVNTVRGAKNAGFHTTRGRDRLRGGIN